jgi:hypothetical protein
MLWGGYKKICMTIRVNNICRPDDPDAWVLPVPGAPTEDAIFQCVKGIFLLFPLGTFALMLWDSYLKFAVIIRVNNLCRCDDPYAWVPPRPGAPGDYVIFQCAKGIFIYLYSCRWPHLATCCEMVTKKYALTVRVNNIFRPDDPHAWVLPGPGAPGKDAIFQYAKRIFLYFDCHCWSHLPTCREVVTKQICRDN